MLTDAQKKRIEDVALGQSINRQIPIESQIAVLRKQVAIISEATKVDLIDEMQKLEDTVAAEKEKRPIPVTIPEEVKEGAEGIKTK